MGTLASLKAIIGADISGLTAGVRKSESLLNSFASRSTRNTDSVGAGFLKMASSAYAAKKAFDFVASAASDIIKVTATFDASVAKIGAVTQASAGDVEKLRQAAIQLGSTTVYTATQVADGMAVLGQAGVSAVEDITPAMKGILSLAAAAGSDLTQATEISVAAMNSFKLSAEQVPHIADVLAKAAQMSAVSVLDLGNSLKYAAPLAAESGQSLEDVVAALTAMGKVGIKSEQAGTTLRTMLTALQKPSDEAAEAMNRYGINVETAAGGMVKLQDIAGILQSRLGGLTEAQRNSALATIFGREAISGTIAVMSAGQAGMENYKKGLTGIDGVADKMASDTLDSLNGELQIMDSIFEKIKITIGTPITSALKDLTKDTNSLFTSISNVVDEGMKLASMNGSWLSGYIDGWHALILEVKQYTDWMTTAITLMRIWNQMKSGDTSEAAAFIKGLAAAPTGNAAGGFISGPGSGTSDSIPAMLSNGEFVINAKATKAFLPLLEAINAKKFAKGGPVGFASGGLSTMSVPSYQSKDFQVVFEQAGLQIDFAQKNLYKQLTAEQEAVNLMTQYVKSTMAEFEAGEADFQAKNNAVKARMEASGSFADFIAAIPSTIGDALNVGLDTITGAAEDVSNTVAASELEQELLDFANGVQKTVEGFEWLDKPAAEDAWAYAASEMEKTGEAVKKLGYSSIESASMQATAGAQITETMRRYQENMSDAIQATTFKNQRPFQSFEDAISQVAGSFTANISELFPYLQDAQKQFDKANKAIWSMWNGAGVALDTGMIGQQQEALLRNLKKQNDQMERDAARAAEMANFEKVMFDSSVASVGAEVEARNTSTMGLANFSMGLMDNGGRLATALNIASDAAEETSMNVWGANGRLIATIDASAAAHQYAAEGITGSTMMAMDSIASGIQAVAGVANMALASLPPELGASRIMDSGASVNLDPFSGKGSKNKDSGASAPINVYVDGQKLFAVMQGQGSRYAGSNVSVGMS